MFVSSVETDYLLPVKSTLSSAITTVLRKGTKTHNLLAMSQKSITTENEMRITLNMALHMASYIECNGYEIDNFWPTPIGSTRVMAENDDIAFVDATQTVDIDSDGDCEAVDTDGEKLLFTFKVLHPLSEKDI